VSALVGILSVIAWTAGIMGPFFYALNFFDLLRSRAEDEELGMDLSKHGGGAYPDDVVISHQSSKVHPAPISDKAAIVAIKSA
jgi:ammonia channel protein AmtB